MGTFGPNIGNTFISDGTLGTIAMTSPSNAQLSDNVYASAGLLLGQISNYLKVTNFNFSVPTDATITGITVNVERNATSLSAVSDSSVRMVKNDVISGDDRASASTWTTSDVVASYGSSTDMWGLSWTSADINSSTFGCVINAAASLAATVNIDQVTITVDYLGSNRPQSQGRRLTAAGLSQVENIS